MRTKATDSLYASALGISLVAAGAALPAFGPEGVFILGGAVTLVAVLVATRVPPRKKPVNNLPSAAPSTASDDQTGWTFMPLPNPV